MSRSPCSFGSNLNYLVVDCSQAQRRFERHLVSLFLWQKKLKLCAFAIDFSVADGLAKMAFNWSSSGERSVIVCAWHGKTIAHSAQIAITCVHLDQCGFKVFLPLSNWEKSRRNRQVDRWFKSTVSLRNWASTTVIARGWKEKFLRRDYVSALVQSVHKRYDSAFA